MKPSEVHPSNFTAHWRFGMTSLPVAKRRASLMRGLRRLGMSDEDRGFLLGQLKALDWIEGLPGLLFPGTSSTQGTDEANQPPESHNWRLRIPMSSR